MTAGTEVDVELLELRRDSDGGPDVSLLGRRGTPSCILSPLPSTVLSTALPVAGAAELGAGDCAGTAPSSTSCVPCQKLLSRDLREVLGDKSGRGSTLAKTSGCEPGIVAVTPRIGSVSSCSGDGSARGATDTRAAAKRIAAAVAVASAGVMGWRDCSNRDCVYCAEDVRISANELRSRWEKGPRFSGMLGDLEGLLGPAVDSVKTSQGDEG